MENKKSNLDLEPNRKIYFQFGLFIVGTVTLMAFTYKTPVYITEKNSVDQLVDVPIEFVAKEDLPVIEIPKVETLPSTTPSTPIFSKDLLNNIKTKEGANDDPQLVVTSSSLDPLSFLPFNMDPGPAPDLAVIVKYPDNEAQFNGNWKGFLIKELKYPQQSIVFKESGTAYVTFVVEIDGSITDVVVRNKDLPQLLQKEAIRVVKASPKWNPGSKNGERVRSTKNVVINFILE